MPTFEVDARCWADFNKLTRAQQLAFLLARDKFVEDLVRGGAFRASLRVKPLQSYPGGWEKTWEGNDDRATFHYGPERQAGQRHVVWRRIGSHEIFVNP